MTCTCGELKLDGVGTGSFNWNPDCEKHGVKSEWYQSPEQVSKRDEDGRRLRELQAEARRRREEARS